MLKRRSRRGRSDLYLFLPLPLTLLDTPLRALFLSCSELPFKFFQYLTILSSVSQNESFHVNSKGDQTRQLDSFHPVFPHGGSFRGGAVQNVQQERTQG